MPKIKKIIVVILPALVVIAVVVYFKLITFEVKVNERSEFNNEINETEENQVWYPIKFYNVPLENFPADFGTSRLSNWGEFRELGYKTEIKGIVRYNYDDTEFIGTKDSKKMQKPIVAFHRDLDRVYYVLCDSNYEIADGDVVEFEGVIEKDNLIKCIKPDSDVKITNTNRIKNLILTEYSKNIAYFQEHADRIINSNEDLRYKFNQTVKDENILIMLNKEYGRYAERYNVIFKFPQQELGDLYIGFIIRGEDKKIKEASIFSIELDKNFEINK